MDHFCPKCKTLLRIGGSKYVLRDGKLFIDQDLYCRNPNCFDNNQKVETVATELPVEVEQK